MTETDLFPAARAESPLPNDDRILSEARTLLGPHTAEALRRAGRTHVVRAETDGGLSLEDALLKTAHGLLADDCYVENEFAQLVLRLALQSAHHQLSPHNPLRRWLQTGDIVDSVFVKLWPDLPSLEFRTKRQFVALLGKRMGFKIKDKLKEHAAKKRSSDRRDERSVELVPPDEYSHPASVVDPERAAERRDQLQRLYAQASILNDRERRILFALLAGKADAEVATAEGLQAPAARMAITRLIRKLRDMNG